MLEPQNRTEEILVAESEEAQFDESDFSTLEEFEKLNYKALFNMPGKLSDSEGMQKVHPRIRPLDSEAEALQDLVQEVVTRLRW